jgi:ectoine hydroxylase-related dioxygenase (phytanoyl-CoA dioxygenase family)
MMLSERLLYRGLAIDPQLVREADGDACEDWAELQVDLRSTLRRRGFVLIRRALSAARVWAARTSVARALESVAEIDAGERHIFARGPSTRSAREHVSGEFWSRVTRAHAVLELAQGTQVEQLMSTLMDEAVVAEQAVYLRAVGTGVASAVHTDYPPLNAPDPATLKVWIALAPVDWLTSPLFLLPMQEALSFLQERTASAAESFRRMAVDGLNRDLNGWLRRHELHVFSACMEPGDVFVFDAMCPHGSFDNTCPRRRVRLSCDVGWQPARRACPQQVGPPLYEPEAYSRFVGSVSVA